MSDDEFYISAIDRFEAMQRNAETQTEELLRAIGTLVTAVAANEATYEIEAASSISDPASLEKTAESISSSRQLLTETVEEAIIAAKHGFHAKHEQNILRNILIDDIDPDSL